MSRVTGGTGVTGNALVRYLLKQNIEVTTLVRRGSNRIGNLPLEDNRLRVIELNLNEYTSCPEELTDREYDTFFHLAWDGSRGLQKVVNRDNDRLQIANIQYDVDAVKLCHMLNIPTFVATGSQAEYGELTEGIDETAEAKPVNMYGMAKLCAGQMSRRKAEEYGIKHIWIRLFSNYGPYDETKSLIDTGIDALLRGESLSYTKGEQLWDYTYSYDAAKAIYLLSQKGKDGEIYNVSSGRPRLLREHIMDMHNIVAEDIAPRFGEVPYSDGAIMCMAPSNRKLCETTGFESEYSFADGIREILKIKQDTKEQGSNFIAQESSDRIREGKCTFVFDIDGVIAKYNPKLDYENSGPNKKMIEIVNKLYDYGNEIILFTARGSKTGIDWSKITEEQMKKFGVKYTELRMGKPAATYYVDDKSMSLEELYSIGEEL